MNIEEYNYDLPEKFIAQTPLSNRSDSKLLLLNKDNGNIKPWNASHVWAPELHFVDGRWYVYYAAGRPSSETASTPDCFNSS